MTPDVAVIIPLYNESENLEDLIRSLNAYFSPKKRSVEVIFVDDGSRDDSAEILKKSAFQGYTARLVKFKRNFGSHAALRAGIREAKARFITSLSADLQDPLELVDRLYERCLEGASVVLATRNGYAVGAFDRFFSKAYAFLMRHFAFREFPANGFDVVMFDQDVKARLSLSANPRRSIFLDILALPAVKAFISYDKKERKKGRSKWTLKKKAALFLNSIVIYSNLSQNLFKMAGGFLAAAVFVWGVRYLYLTQNLLRDREGFGLSGRSCSLRPRPGRS